MITVCITSCNRFDLLKTTIDSFLKLNTYPISKYFLNEDSGNPEMVEKIKSQYGDLIEIIFNGVNQGLLQSVDNLYQLVETEYIMHIEDDWLFQGNPNFIAESLTILQENPNIHQVWIRHGIPDSWLEQPKNKIYRMVKNCHFGDWCGFSFNPGLRRKSDYLKMFPNGFNVHNLHGSNSVLSEHDCNMVASAQGYRAAILNKPACRHIGDGKSTYK